MDIDTRPQRPDPYGIVTALVAALLAAAWWGDFSGPFRWLVDRELRLFGNYHEAFTALALAVLLYFPVWLVESIAKAMLPKLPWGSVFRIGFSILFVAGSIGAMCLAWWLWPAAAPAETAQAAVRTIDMKRFGQDPLPAGRLRVMGVADRAHLIVIRSARHRGTGGYSQAYVPIRAHQASIDAPARLVAVRRGTDDTDVAPGVPDDPQGTLLAQRLDTRVLYAFKRTGVAVEEHARLLAWPAGAIDEAFDQQIEAGLIVLFVSLFWFFAVRDWLVRRKSGPAVKAAEPAQAVEAAMPAWARPCPRCALGVQMVAFCASMIGLVSVVQWWWS